ncbi:MAG: hypothetical protein KJP15_04380 [Gammaproteobacteria bacterium]|nr:hypothetical protein [Gammaproteobacteria bacterium]
MSNHGNNGSIIDGRNTAEAAIEELNSHPMSTTLAPYFDHRYPADIIEHRRSCNPVLH